MALGPTEIVEAGYDCIASRYLAWIDEIRGDPRLRFLDDLVTRLPARPRVLDLGCGAGVPCTALLAERGDVIGVDLSTSQLGLAREKVPAAHFVRADMGTVEFRPARFDAITAFYSVTHVHRDQHAGLLRRVATWLRSDGLLLAVLGSREVVDVVDEWLGAPMFFSSHNVETNRRLLAGAGLAILVDETLTMQEPEGPSTFQWIIAKKM